MLNYTAKLIESDMIVGRDEGNHFAIEITPRDPSLDAWVDEEVVLRISIPFGKTRKSGEETFLLPDGDARPHVKYRSPADSAENEIDIIGKDPDLKPASSSVCWEIPDGIGIAPGQKMRIDVTGLSGKMAEGTAVVTVGMKTFDDNEFSEETVDVPTTLAEGETGKPAIHYFDGTPDYVLHAGDDPVELFFFTSGAKDVTLFRNNVEIWPLHSGSKKDLSKTDKPGITSVYRLEAATAPAKTPEERQQQIADKTRTVKSLTIQVAQAGWNRQPLHQGYPTVLFATQTEGDPLYGVFVNPETKPETVGLYSSETGFPPWEKEGDIPENMSHSPGVATPGKLWLIGGSSVDRKPLSSEVWCYYKEKRTKEANWFSAGPGGFPKRMGHCVVHFKKKLWVLGGSDGTSPLGDVWSYDYATDGARWHRETAEAKWTARCLFSAVATPVIEGVTAFNEEKMWVYGGTDSPSVILGKRDLWSTTDGVTWKPEDDLELGPLPGLPNGATLFWDDDRLHLAGSFKAPTRGTAEDYKGGALSAMVYSLCASRQLWEANPVSWGWEQFGGSPFLMQSLVFNRFWFFWSLYRKIEIPPKLNVFIPS